MRAFFLSLGVTSLLLVACGGDGTSSTGTGGTTGTSSSTSSAGGGTSTSTSTSTTSAGGGTSTSTSTSSSTGAGGGTSSVDGFTEAVAGSICGALMGGCCDAQSQQDYFGPWAQNTLLASFVDQIPPKHAFADKAECTATVKKMLDITPFGDWVAQVQAGRVTFDEAAFNACKATLDGAACGKDVGIALYDGTCFGFGPPPGGPLQRKTFHRTGKLGDACAPIRDGVGAGFFGTCDPTAFFCCYADPASPGKCALPFDKNGVPRAGSCKAASKVGESCSILGSLQVCATGTSCDSASDHCVSDGDAPLATGDMCVDANFNLLGTCQNSYCDVLGTGQCQPLKADGKPCGGGEECQSTACVMGACGAPTFCKGP